MADLQDIFDRLACGEELDRTAALRLLSPMERADRLKLFSLADRATAAAFGGRVEFCAIINARSGKCSEDCTFCAQSAHYKTAAPAHELVDRDAVKAAAARAKEGGAVRFSVVISGKAATDKQVDQISAMVEDIASLGLKPCASLGCLSQDQLARLTDAGLDRYHHNLETARTYYPHICTTHTYEERVETLEAARAVGLGLCSGGIFGLGEEVAHRLEMIEALKEIGVDSVAVNFLNPIPGTPLDHRPLLDPWEALSILAVIRLLMPRTEIRTCGGRTQTLGALSPLQYLAGANATMTGDYLTTDGPQPDTDRAELEQVGLQLALPA